MRHSSLRLVSHLAPLAMLGLAACSGAASGAGEHPGQQAAGLSSAGAGPVTGLAGKCLDDAGDATNDGNRIQLYTCNGTDAQSWTYVNGTLVGPSGKCLDVTGANPASGTPVELWDCNGGENQQWQSVNGQLVGLAGKCLDVTGNDPDDGTQVELWDCNGGANQQWSFAGGTTTSPTPPPTSPPAPPAPPPTSSTIHSVYVGNDPGDVTQYESWLGQPTDGILGYTGNASWSDFDGSIPWAAGLWAPLDRRVLWSVPLIPDGASLAEAATGAYDSHYVAAAQALVGFRPQDDVLYIRTAWEWNGTWMPWSVGQGDIGNFIGAWQHFVNAFRSVSATRFRFDWCPSIGTNPYPLEDAYPGDAYVDIVGMDVYDEDIWWKIADPDTRWEQEYLTSDHGLNWLTSFAAAHGKNVSIPEWGTGGSGAGDDPAFVAHMHDWLAANNAVYASYWNSNSAYAGQLSLGQYPNAAATYRELFGP